jgi:hypothetical protein
MELPPQPPPLMTPASATASAHAEHQPAAGAQAASVAFVLASMPTGAAALAAPALAFASMSAMVVCARADALEEGVRGAVRMALLPLFGRSSPAAIGDVSMLATFPRVVLRWRARTGQPAARPRCASARPAPARARGAASCAARRELLQH